MCVDFVCVAVQKHDVSVHIADLAMLGRLDGYFSFRLEQCHRLRFQLVQESIEHGRACLIQSLWSLARLFLAA